MLISTNTLLEFTSTRLDNTSEDTPSRSSDGEFHHLDKITGKSPTPGLQLGECPDSSRSSEESTNVELNRESLLVLPND